MKLLGYQLKLVARGLRRDRGYSSVMVVSLALSVSLLVTAVSAYRRFSSSSVVRLPGVFRVQPRHNALEPFFQGGEFGEFASFVNFIVDAQVERALAASDVPRARSSSFTAGLSGGPLGGSVAVPIAVRFCERDLFGMFAMPFRFGGPWRAGAAEATGAAADTAVLNAQLNEQWFGGADSVGRTVMVEGRRLTVVGVLAPPPTVLQIWDFNPFLSQGELLIPATLAEALRPMPRITFPPHHPADWPALVAGSQRFIEHWVFLPDEDTRARFEKVVAGIDPTLHLVSADALIAALLQNPPEYTVFAIFTAVLVVASVLNTVRLLFARALARSAELGIHRALGAPRGALFTRQLIEDLVVVAAGATVGVLAGIPAVRLFDTLIPDLPTRLVADPVSVAFSWLFCLLLGLLAGLYPAIRIAFVLPTRYLERA